METDQYVIGVYVIYSAVSVGLVVWLARTLFRNGALFLEDVFAETPALAEAVNRLLVIGFYLLNLGYAFLILRADEAIDGISSMEVLVSRLGLLFVSLGVLHLLNMYFFYRIRRRAQVATLPPPVAPQITWTPPTAEPAGS